MKESQIQKTIDFAYEKYTSFQKKIQETGYDSKFAKMVMDVDDPDEEFLSRKLLQLTSQFDEIGNMVQYLHRPVKTVGNLSVVGGRCYLSGEELSGGTTIEFMYQGKWYIGRLNCSQEKAWSIISEDQKITVPVDSKMRVRIR